MIQVRTAIGLIATVALLAAPSSVLAQVAAGEGWLGKDVVQKTSGFALRLPTGVVERSRTQLPIYRVENVNGPWLWLRARGLEGYGLADEVVLVDKAIDHFTSQIRANPGDSFGYTMRAKILRDVKGEIDLAISDYNEAIRLDPTAGHLYAARGNAWRAKKQYDRAIANYDEAIKLDPKEAITYSSRGNAWQDMREYDRAIADYGEAIKLDPKYTAAYTNRGNAWYGKQEYDLAAADYGEAIKLDPKYTAAYTNRGNAWYGKKDYDRAIADHGEAIRLDPKLAIAYQNRGHAWYSKQDYDRALADYGEAIKLDPKLAIAYQNRGDAYRAKRDYDRAVASYGEAIRLAPSFPWPHYGLAVVSLLTDGSRAEPEARATIEIGGWRGDRAVSAAIIGSLGSRRAKQHDAATRLLEDAAEKCDTSTWPYPAVRFLRRQIDEKALLDLAVDEDKRTEARCLLGLDYAIAGRPDAARSHFLWVKQHGNPSMPEYSMALAELDRLDASPKP
jgi:tetratricopeptide (TPR) repeat protein